MKLVNAANGEATISMAKDELSFLWHAIHETLNVVREWEFKTRTRETRKRAEELMLQLEDFLEELSKSEARPKS